MGKTIFAGVMSNKENDEETTCTEMEECSINCSMTFQNAIEIDFKKLKEMTRNEEQEEQEEQEGVNNVTTELHMEDSLTVSVLNDGSGTTGRDLSVYERPITNTEYDSSDDENDSPSTLRTQELEPETEVENSEDNSEDEIQAPYEQLGSTEFTKANSDEDGDHSDMEFGDYESCPVSYDDGSDSKEYSTVDGSTDISGTSMNEQHNDIEDLTQDVLGDHHPRTAAKAIPPLDQEKIALIKQTMAGLTLKPSPGAARVAEAVIKAKPRIGDELKHKAK